MRATGLRSLGDARTLARFVHNLKEGVYITDASGRILDANPAFLEMFGVPSLAELNRYTALDLLVDPTRRTEELAILAREGSVREFELAIRTPAGRVRVVLDTAYQVTDPGSDEVLYHGILVDITERKLLEEQLREMAIHDPLTGCYNRFFLRQLQTSPDGEAHRWGVVAIDIDGFKAYNDRHGHDTGDRVLVEMSRFLHSRLREEDVVVRTGGDEFVVLLANRSLRETQAAARRLLAASAREGGASISVGWASQQPGEQLEETIRRADHHLIARRVAAGHPQAGSTTVSRTSR
ncbi:MAG: sensor domain-containing diguanylate cyclase [Thermoanaerobaculaceae bacterium]|nr:sensor domain-containing diguanylate cyclase [Thermoanaerobaculaceae bacterium]